MTDFTIKLPPGRKPVMARCSVEECAHEWPVLYTPLPLGVSADLMKRAACPMCGDKKPRVAM